MRNLSFTTTMDTIEHIDCSINALGSYGERVLFILEQQKRSNAWLAGKIGISKQSLNYVLNHSKKPKFVSEIATALQVTPDWLKTGSGSIAPPVTDQYRDLSYIPIVRLTDLPLLKGNKLISEQFVMAAGTLSENCFAIHLDSRSMEPLFRNGSILIFDPQLSPKTGDFVVFTLIKNTDILFRQLFIEGTVVYLRAADPMYQVISNEEVVIHGVLVESRYCFK